MDAINDCSKVISEPLISFESAVSQRLIEEYAGKLRSAISTLKLSESSAAVIFFVFIEMAQNICKYSARVKDGAGYGKITVNLTDGECEIESRNPISAEKVDELRNHLATISKMNREELRKFFGELIRERERLFYKKESDKQDTAEIVHNGGGVGLVQIAQAAKEPIKYSFLKSGDDTEFILRASLRVTLNND